MGEFLKKGDNYETKKNLETFFIRTADYCSASCCGNVCTWSIRSRKLDLFIQDVNLVENPFQNIGIAFSIHLDFFDEETFDKDSF